MIFWLSLGLFLGVNVGFVAGAWWATRRKGSGIEDYLRDANRRNAELEMEFDREHPETASLKDYFYGWWDEQANARAAVDAIWPPKKKRRAR